MRDRMMCRVIKRKCHTDDEALALADVGWDEEQERYTFPVRDEAGEIVQVIYRDLRDDRPAGALGVGWSTISGRSGSQFVTGMNAMPSPGRPRAQVTVRSMSSPRPRVDPCGRRPANRAGLHAAAGRALNRLRRRACPRASASF